MAIGTLLLPSTVPSVEVTVTLIEYVLPAVNFEFTAPSTHQRTATRHRWWVSARA